MGDDGAAASSAADEPTIEPTSFDLIVSGTGLASSLIAAAASAVGKSVLHVDPNPFYGSHFASLSPRSISSFLGRNSHPTAASPDTIHRDTPDYVAVDLEDRRVYTEVEFSGEVPEPSGSFLLDLCGPRLFYCADPAVDLMLRSGASHHVEFKSLDASMLYWEGKLQHVPDSREAIFKDRSLGLTEKTQMMRFLKLVREHIEADGREGKDGSRISEEDMEIPFVEFLDKQRLPPKIKTIVLYAISMADHDQNNKESCHTLMNTREGLASLSLYSSSIGRFPNAVGPFIYPIYGQGELPQAFCRCAAVKGALYVLRMPISGLLFNKEAKEYKGVTLVNGQDIFSRYLLMDSSFKIPSFILPDVQDGEYDTWSTIENGRRSGLASKVARVVCITKSSLYHGLANILVVFPPGSLFPGQRTSVRALQLASNLAVCPPGFFVVYLSVKCDNAAQGKDILFTAMSTLFKLPGEEDSDNGGHTNKGEDNVISNNQSADSIKPRILWSALYVQELAQAVVGPISSSPLPDGNLDYGSLLESTKKVFLSMYPQEQFFPPTQNADDNDESDVSQD